MNAIHTEEHAGFNIEIWPEEYPENPRTEFDHAATMACFHRRYDLGDKHEFSDPEELVAFVQSDDVVSLPLYLYDHSGITMSTGRGYPFNDPWDSSQVGFIYMTKADIRENWGVKKVTKAVREKAIQLMEAEVSEYDDYLTGNIYGFTVTDPKDPSNSDSCGGFFGDYRKYCLIEARNMAEVMRREKVQKHFAKLKTWITNRVPLDKRTPFVAL